MHTRCCFRAGSATMLSLEEGTLLSPEASGKTGLEPSMSAKLMLGKVKLVGKSCPLSKHNKKEASISKKRHIRLQNHEMAVQHFHVVKVFLGNLRWDFAKFWWQKNVFFFFFCRKEANVAQRSTYVAQRSPPFFEKRLFLQSWAWRSSKVTTK